MATQSVKKEQKGFAVTSMVCGIFSLAFFWTSCWIINFPAMIVALVFGIISLAKKKGGKGMAIAGVATAGAAILLYAFLILAGIFIIAANGTYYY